MRWGIFWKRLKYSLENATLIIEGSIRLHNFLVDYRESYVIIDEETEEKSLFTEDARNSRECTMVVGDDVGVRGNISNSEKDQRYKGLKLRDSLRLSLVDHDIHRPRKEEYFDDDNIHVHRN